jgi:quercetin dioxygenase-like cupin family protein
MIRHEHVSRCAHPVTSEALGHGYVVQMQHQRLRELPARDPTRIGADVRVVTGERLQLLYQNVPAGVALPPHRHDNEQLTLVLRGRLRAFVDGREVLLGAEEVFVVPADVEHSIEVLMDAVVVDVFAPPRPDLA